MKKRFEKILLLDYVDDVKIEGVDVVDFDRDVPYPSDSHDLIIINASGLYQHTQAHINSCNDGPDRELRVSILNWSHTMHTGTALLPIMSGSNIIVFVPTYMLEQEQLNFLDNSTSNMEELPYQQNTQERNTTNMPRCLGGRPNQQLYAQCQNRRASEHKLLNIPWENIVPLGAVVFDGTFPRSIDLEELIRNIHNIISLDNSNNIDSIFRTTQNALNSTISVASAYENTIQQTTALLAELKAPNSGGILVLPAPYNMQEALQYIIYEHPQIPKKMRDLILHQCWAGVTFGNTRTIDVAKPQLLGNGELESEYKSFLDIGEELHGTTKQHLYEAAYFFAAYDQLEETHSHLKSPRSRIQYLMKNDKDRFSQDISTFYGFLRERKNWRDFYRCFGKFAALYPDDKPITTISKMKTEQPKTFSRSEAYYLNLIDYRDYFKSSVV